MTTTAPAGKRVQHNILLVHWHDLGRHLGTYGYQGVSSPRLDQLGSEGIVFTQAHATAPLCSPSRGSLFTGRYPHSNGLVGLAHHGWEYLPQVRTLPGVLSELGWETVLFGMQHETSFPSRLGFDSFDVSNSYCDYVTERSVEWLRQRHEHPFLLTAGFFETHRPYPAERYVAAAEETVEVPPYLPDTPEVRADLAQFYGAIAVADAAVGRMLDTLTETGLDRSTWVVFVTDHGPAFPRAKSTLYEPGTAIALIIRPPAGAGLQPSRYDGLFSGVDLMPTLLDLLGVAAGPDVEGVSHAALLGQPGPQKRLRQEVFTEKSYHDSFDPIRAIRTTEFSYIENYAARPELDLPLDILASPSGQAVSGGIGRVRAARELYDLGADPDERDNLLSGPRAAEYAAVAEELAFRLYHWRAETGDVIPSEFVGERISERYTEDYQAIHGLTPNTRSALATDRGVEEEASQ